MKIVAASDIHGLWEEVVFPEGDVLILAGDICRDYLWGNHTIDAELQYHRDLDQLNDFLGNLKKEKKYKHIILIAGNHDFCFQHRHESSKKLTNAIYLEDSSIKIDGVKFYGSPWTKWFWDWAFNFPDHNSNLARTRAHARRRWGAIPSDTQVLVIHGPPYGILDAPYRGGNVGDEWLLERIKELAKKSLKLTIFGHIHYSYGQETHFGVKFVNAAQCGPHDKIVNKPHVIELC